MLRMTPCLGLNTNIAPSNPLPDCSTDCASWQATDADLQLVGCLNYQISPSFTLPFVLVPASIVPLVHQNYRDSTFRNPPYVAQRPTSSGQDKNTAYPRQLRHTPIKPNRLSFFYNNAIGRALPPPAGTFYIHDQSDNTQNLKYHHHLRQRSETIHLGMLATGSPTPLFHHRRHLGRRIRATGRDGRH